MNKMMLVILSLCIAVSAVAMELEVTKEQNKKEVVSLLITPEENEKFISYVNRRVGFCNTVNTQPMSMTATYVPKDNPISTMLHMLSVDFLKDCNNNVLELIKTQELEERINNYKKSADSSRVVKFCLQQISDREGDVNEARSLVAKNRQLLAELTLQKLQTKYFCDYLENTQITGRINYMKRNAEYPTDEKAIKDFIALLIYQVIFAHQTHKK